MSRRCSPVRCPPLTVLQKRRGKRKHPDESSSSPVTEIPAKKTKTDTPMSKHGLRLYPLSAKALTVRRAAQYSKEVKSYAGRSLKDDGIGVRPLVK